MLNRDKSGRIKKARVRVGDIATIDKSSKVLGLTAGKGYKVVATALSKEANKSYIGTHFQWKCVTENHFIVINDRGERTFCSLTPHNPNYNVEYSARLFGEWTV